MKSVIKFNREKLGEIHLPSSVYHFRELALQIVLIVEVNERYKPTFEFLDLVEVVIERGCVANS